MYISHKSNVLQTVHETEWQCRRKVKGQSKSEYWTWLATVTSGDPPVVDYSGETGYTIVECTDEDVSARLNQLGDYVNSNRLPDEALVYNITWSDSKVSAVTGQDEAGEDITIQTHFSGNDTTKDARLLADKWTAVRRDRDRRLSQTDYLALSDNTVSGAMQIYRQKLRDVPAQSDVDNITWPTKP
jgi:hypothetical protein